MNRAGLDRFSGLYLWALFIAVFAVWVPDLFLTTTTLRTIASEQAIVGMLAIAALIPLAAGVYDLSIGATINLAAISVTWAQEAHGWDMWPAIGLTLAIGLTIGAINGLLVIRLQVNSFIATLGTATVISAVQQIMTGQTQPLPPTSTAWRDLAQRQVFGLQIVVVYLLVLALVAWWLMERTPTGRYVHATGANPEAARLAGVDVDRYRWLTLVASGGIAGVAGVLYASQNGPSLTFGPALLLPAFAAAFLGSTQIYPGRFNVWGSMLAIYVLATGVKGLQLVTGVQWLNDMFNGVALIAAVAFASWRLRRKSGIAPRRRVNWLRLRSTRPAGSTQT